MSPNCALKLCLKTFAWVHGLRVEGHEGEVGESEGRL